MLTLILVPNETGKKRDFLRECVGKGVYISALRISAKEMHYNAPYDRRVETFASARLQYLRRKTDWRYYAQRITRTFCERISTLPYRMESSHCPTPVLPMTHSSSVSDPTNLKKWGRRRKYEPVSLPLGVLPIQYECMVRGCMKKDSPGAPCHMQMRSIKSSRSAETSSLLGTACEKISCGCRAEMALK